MTKKIESHVRLKEIMKIRNLSQSDIVEKTTIKKSALSQYVSGKITPRQNAIEELAKVLNVSEPWLMGYDVPIERNRMTNFEKRELIEKLKSYFKSVNITLGEIKEKYNIKTLDDTVNDGILLKIANDYKIKVSQGVYLSKNLQSENKRWFLELIESLTEDEMAQLRNVIEPTIKIIINNKGGN